jgi:hypothetical protein
MLTIAFFITAPHCLSFISRTDKQTDRQKSILMKRILLSTMRRNVQATQTMTQVNVRILTLHTSGQTQKTTYGRNPLMLNTRKDQPNLPGSNRAVMIWVE